MIIKVEPNPNGSHANQSTTPHIIPDGWVELPRHLEAAFVSSGTFCDLLFDGGVLVDIIPLPSPELEPMPPVINPQDDTDAMLVDHELRLTLLELGGI